MLAFVKSPLGNALIMLVAVTFIGGFVIVKSLAQGGDGDFTEASEDYDYKPTIHERDIPRFKLPNQITINKTEPNAQVETEEASETAVSRPQLARQKKSKNVLPLNLFVNPSRNEAGLSENYAPFGRLVPCELTITVESNSISTPIIGLVTEDVVHAGRVIIPAGAEVHGKASEGRSRDRIEATGTWNFVWRTQNFLNGTELTLEGIALDREIDFNTGLWGLRDGSAGLKGYLIKSDNWNEIKLFAATFLAAATQGIKDYDEFITETGSTVQLAKSTASNAALDGTTAILEEYAQQIREAILQDGFYIRIPTGKQFYVYVTQTIDAREGSRGNASNLNIWNNDG
jgi:hypothetical protein